MQNEMQLQPLIRKAPITSQHRCFSPTPFSCVSAASPTKMKPAFLQSVPLSRSKTCNFISPLINPRLTIPTKPFRRLRTPKSAWEDTLLPEPPRPKLSPQTYHTLHLLSLSSTKPLAYATAQPPNTPRKPYATNSSALPLPFDKPEKPILQDAFTHLHSTKFKQAFGRSDLPSALLSALGLSRAQCVNSGNRALAVVQVICGAGAELQLVYVEEAPSTAFEIRGVLILRVPAGSLCGETVYKQTSVFVSPAFAVAVGNVAGVDVLVEKTLFEEACIVVEDMVNVYEARGGMPVVEKTILGDAAEEDTDFVVPWEIKASEIDGLTDDVIRSSLRRCGVGVTRREGREVLLKKFVKMMDEVERRELGVLLAAREGMYGLAAELQAGRSQRGKLLAAMKEAEKKGNWAEVMKLGMKIRKLEKGTMDITAEPGSYSRDLDCDDWYEPCR